MKCPVCGKENMSMLCPECGFDSSRDYEEYPTLAPVGSVPSVSARRRQWCLKEQKPEVVSVRAEAGRGVVRTPIRAPGNTCPQNFERETLKAKRLVFFGILVPEMLQLLSQAGILPPVLRMAAGAMELIALVWLAIQKGKCPGWGSFYKAQMRFLVVSCLILDLIGVGILQAGPLILPDVLLWPASRRAWLFTLYAGKQGEKWGKTLIRFFAATIVGWFYLIMLMMLEYFALTFIMALL